MRVLHIGMSPNVGGLESFVKSMYENIKDDVTFDFVNIYDEPLAYEDYYKSCGSKIIKITPRRKNPYKSFKELKKIISNGNYDYIHYHCMTYCWPEPIIIGYKYGNKKVIVHSHLTGFNKNTILKEKILHFIGKCRINQSKILKLACGNEAGKWLFGNNNFVIINNGINQKLFKYSEKNRKEIREKYNFIESDIIIGHVGNFSYQKNYPLLIGIFVELLQKEKNFKLLLIGDHEKMSCELKELINSSGCSDKIILTGKIGDAYKYYSAMDLYIFPSHYEGLNISMIEAQCSGLQCFASNKLDPETNVGGYYTTIDIDSEANAIAQVILNKLDLSTRRDTVSISKNYLSDEAAKKLLAFYKKNQN